jgi:hypothetical protein
LANTYVFFVITKSFFFLPWFWHILIHPGIGMVPLYREFSVCIESRIIEWRVLVIGIFECSKTFFFFISHLESLRVAPYVWLCLENLCGTSRMWFDFFWFLIFSPMSTHTRTATNTPFDFTPELLQMILNVSSLVNARWSLGNFHFNVYLFALTSF